MTLRLEQHIFGSTSRLNFETLAASPAIDHATRQLLKPHEEGYPEMTAWNGETPPLVVRGYRPSPPDAGYGLSLLRYVGASLNRAAGNYVAHSYLIPPEVVAEQQHNLPWIAAHLPCRFKYQPQRGSGADSLDPLEVTIETGPQLTMFGFVVREMTAGVTRALVNAYVERQGGRGPAQPLDLVLPPPADDLDIVFADQMGADRTVPGPDALRLMRLAGLLAILPPAFKRDVSFTVNETSTEHYAIRVPRAAEPIDGATAPWPWFDTCVGHAAAGRHDDLANQCAWLASLLPIDYGPGRTALDLGFEYYRDCVAASAGRDRIDDMIALLRRMRGLSLSVEPLHASASAACDRLGSPFDTRAAMYAALSEVCAGARMQLPPVVLNGACRCLDTGTTETQRGDFLRRLAPEHQGQIWAATYDARARPAFVREPDGVVDKDDLKFALSNLRIGGISRHAGGMLIEHYAHALSDIRVFPGSPPGGLGIHGPAVNGLAALAYTTPAYDVAVALAERFAAAFDVTLPARTEQLDLNRLNAAHQLQSIIEPLLYGERDVNATVLAAFTARFCRERPHEVRALLSILRTSRTARRRTAAFLDQLRRMWRAGGATSAAIGALIELLELVQQPERARCDGESQLTGLLRLERQVDDDSPYWEAFYHQLRQALTDLTPVEVVAIGTCYLRVYRERRRLLGMVVSNFEHHSSAIGQWVSDVPGYQVPKGPAGFLAHLLIAAKRDRLQYEGMWAGLRRLFTSLDRHRRECVLLQLQHYFDELKAPSDARRFVREGLHSLRELR